MPIPVSRTQTLIGYVTLGTNDMQKAAKFYDALAKEMGTGRMMETEQFIAYGTPGGGAGIGIGITKPHDGNKLNAFVMEHGGQ